MREPNQIDKIIGINLANKRLECGFTQEKLGASLSRPIVAQQISKFEHGIDKISSSQLVECAVALGCPIQDLCAGVAELLPPLRAPRGDHKAFMDDYLELSADMRATVRELVRAIMKDTARRLQA